MKRIAVFPGSFDPVTIGHVDIVQRALPLFDQLIIGIGINSRKQYLFPLEKRMQWLRQIFGHEPRISIESYTGLTVNFCEQRSAQFILRGIRSSADFEFEKSIAQANRVLSRRVETVFLLANPSLSVVSSSVVRDIILNGGDVKAFVPEEIEASVRLGD
ncbi:MAG: pantetheine-phosphate adenylyltransferase [Chitinophagales bacterium]|nr:pantetheine-phosphate adenylyltransferase [Chitinophagales bacterium]MDW8428189.1 pantetheine-phosphate adenylyltransferase [Chitinophagales bacterium]